MQDQLKLFLFEGVSPIRLDAYRRCLAASFAFYMTYLLGNAKEWLTSDGYHVTADTQLIHAAPPWPTMEQWMVPIFATVMLVAAFCLMAGKFTRISTCVVLACAIYVHRVDALSAFALNKLFIVGFLVLAFAPPPREVKHEDGSRELLQSVWPIRILQATLIIIYFTSGICKGFHGDWLSDGNVVWTIVQGVFRTDLSSFMLRTMPRSFFTTAMLAVLFFELFAPLLFAIKRIRPFVIAFGIFFHLCLAAMMSTVIFFSAQMITYYVLFFDEDTLRSLYDWLTPAKWKTIPQASIESIIEDSQTNDSQKISKLEDLIAS